MPTNPQLTGGARLLPTLALLALLGCEVDPLQTPDQEFKIVIDPQTVEVDVADEAEFTAVAVSLQGDTIAIPLTWTVAGDTGATVTSQSSEKQKVKTGMFVGRRAGDWEVTVEDPNGLVASAQIRVRRRIRFDRVRMQQVHQAQDTAVVRYEILGRRSTRLACVDVRLVRLTPGVHLERLDCPDSVRIRYDLMVIDPQTRETLDPRQLAEEVKFFIPKETMNQVLSLRRDPVWWGG